tara:strand:+ start:373 stop:681 length:309 start_codon:yes stop_codon:yes gene_type:complete
LRRLLVLGDSFLQYPTTGSQTALRSNFRLFAIEFEIRQHSPTRNFTLLDDADQFDKNIFVARPAIHEAMSERWSGIMEVVAQQASNVGIEIKSGDVMAVPTA